MQIDFENLTILNALMGGGILGVSASVYLIFNGKIAGVSSNFAQLIFFNKSKNAIIGSLFIIGIILAPVIYQQFLPMEKIVIQTSNWQLAIGGLLVGFGAKLGSGCTSGHGICGIARFSVRSIVATVIFLFTAIVTVFINSSIL